jgi:hypothetical protein
MQAAPEPSRISGNTGSPTSVPRSRTKFLFFAGHGTEAEFPALILDSKLRSWLCTHTGWRLNGTWQVDYNRYLRTVADWARRLESPGLAPETVEELIFTSHSTTAAATQKACSHPASARLWKSYSGSGP